MTTIGSAELGRAVLRLTVDTTEFAAGLSQSFSKVERFGRIARSVGLAITAIAGPLAAIGVLSVKTFAEYAFNLKRAAVVTNATAEGMARLTEVTQRLGRETIFTARQAAEAAAFLGLAGLRSQEVVEALPAALDLAAAGQIQLTQATRILTSNMAAFGIEAENSTRIVDVLAAAATGSNTTLGEMGHALSFVSGIARSAGVGIEETAASLMVMANNAIQSGRAGRALRQGILRLINPTRRGADVLNKYGIVTRDLAGQLRDLPTVLVEIQQAGLSTAEMARLFGIEAMPGMAAAVRNASIDLQRFREELHNAEGAGHDLAENVLDNLQGDFIRLKSAIEGVRISIGESLNTVMRAVTKRLTEVARAIAVLFQRYPILSRVVIITTAAITALALVLIAFGAILPYIVVSLGFVQLALTGVAAVASALVAIITPFLIPALLLIGVTAATTICKLGSCR